MLSLSSVVTATEEQISTDLDGEVVILNMAAGTYFSLSSVGATIWSRIQNPRSVQSLLDTVLTTYKVDAERCQADLLRLLEDLYTEGLITVRAEKSS